MLYPLPFGIIISPLILTNETLINMDNRIKKIRLAERKSHIDVCFVINSEVREREKETEKALSPQFEVNLPTAMLNENLENIFKG